MLLSLKTAAARTHLPSIPLRHRISAVPAHLRFTLRRTSSIRMSSSAANPNQIIEHIVLFKVKPAADPAAVSAMLANLNALTALDPVLHLSAGPVHRCRSGSLSFTHLLHSRYRSKSDLQTYADHPTHVSVVTNYVKPVIDDIMAVDWVADGVDSAVVVPPGAAVRLTALKLKEGVGEEGKSDVLGVIGGVKGKFASIDQMTVGENFSPGRNKGFEICSVAVFKGVKELDLEAEAANAEKDKVREFLDGVLVLDFVVGAAVGSATL